MRIVGVEFIGSYGHPHPLPRERRPEVAFFGRSNVGKSSLINTLLGRRGVARISKTPGKTRSANFFRINDRFFLVDMPGYGYARASKTEIARWAHIVADYLDDARDDRPRALVQLVDMRHEPTEADVASVARLAATGHPLCVVFTKADKVAASRRAATIRAGLAVLGAPGHAAVVPFSSVTREGKRPLWAWIEESLGL